MNEQQRLFLVQARSTYIVFKLLKAESKKTLPPCHARHYLQMATELLGKANAWRDGSPGTTHKALVMILKRLSTNRKAQTQLGYGGQNENWGHTLRKFYPIAETLQRLAPALAGDGPNAEYPWPPAEPHTAPVEHVFPVWEVLIGTASGRALLSLLDNLFQIAEEYM